MFNKTLLNSSVSILICSLSFAGGYVSSPESSTPTGWGVAFVHKSLQDSSAALELNYKTAAMEYGITASAEFNYVHGEKSDDGDKDWQEFPLDIYAGKRMPLAENFTSSYGLNYGYKLNNNPNDGDSTKYDAWTLGAYTQFSYEPNRHVSIFSRSLALSYEEFGTNKQHEFEVFQENYIGISYHWAM